MLNLSTNKKIGAWFALIALSSAVGSIFIRPVIKEPPRYVDLHAQDGVMRFAFDGDDVIEETPSEEKSIDPNWWVNSGARLYISGGTGRTVAGELPASSGWKIIYAGSDPSESDAGARPQNIFRMFTKLKAENIESSYEFRVLNTNLSPSGSRNESNGVFIFGRYLDGNNFYVAGVRVDGMAVIKKKTGGSYHTMGIKRIFGGGNYHKVSAPNFIPQNEWLGLKIITRTKDDGRVLVQFFVDYREGGGWEGVLEAEDNGASFGGPVLSGEGASGIRTDFMDVEFDNFELKKI